MEEGRIMNIKIEIRKAKNMDIDCLINLYGQLIDYECQYYYFLRNFKDFNNKAISCLKEDFLNWIKDDKHNVMVATFENKIVGLIHGHIKDSYFYIGRILELVELVVDEEYRHIGIAQQLYDELINWGKQNKTEEIHLSVFHKNDNAVKFYKKNRLNQHSMKMKGKLL